MREVDAHMHLGPLQKIRVVRPNPSLLVSLHTYLIKCHLPDLYQHVAGNRLHQTFPGMCMLCEERHRMEAVYPSAFVLIGCWHFRRNYQAPFGSKEARAIIQGN